MTNLAKNTETNVSTYEQSANDFLNKTGATIEISFLRNGKHFDDDKDSRDIYKITVKRGSRSMVFNFGQSTMNSQYYQDSIKGRTYTLNGSCRTGNYSINDIAKYQTGGQKLILVKGKKPTNYDILACLQKYEVGTFDDFCGDFGYDTDSRKAEKIYDAVVKEYTDLCTLFSDAEIEEMKEIN